MLLVLYRVTNHMAGAPPLTERNWYIYNRHLYIIAIDIIIYQQIYAAIVLRPGQKHTRRNLKVASF